MMRVVTIKMPEKLLEELDLYCKEKGRHRSEVIRDAVEYYLYQRHKYKPKLVVRTEKIAVYE